jgi:hypothetical protein
MYKKHTRKLRKHANKRVSRRTKHGVGKSKSKSKRHHRSHKKSMKMRRQRGGFFSAMKKKLQDLHQQHIAI